MKRVAVVGVTGSGKSTLAAELARRLGAPYIELDALQWGPGWAPCPRDQFRQRVAEVTAGETWVTDGNYGEARSILWTRADTLVWLDYPLGLALWRLLGRTLRRVFTREELWNGNRETFYGVFLAPDNLFAYAFVSQRRHRREYPKLLAQPEYAHLRLVHLRRPRDAERWLATL